MSARLADFPTEILDLIFRCQSIEEHSRLLCRKYKDRHDAPWISLANAPVKINIDDPLRASCKRDQQQCEGQIYYKNIRFLTSFALRTADSELLSKLIPAHRKPTIYELIHIQNATVVSRALHTERRSPYHSYMEYDPAVGCFEDYIIHYTNFPLPMVEKLWGYCDNITWWISRYYAISPERMCLGMLLWIYTGCLCISSLRIIAKYCRDNLPGIRDCCNKIIDESADLEMMLSTAELGRYLHFSRNVLCFAAITGSVKMLDRMTLMLRFAKPGTSLDRYFWREHLLDLIQEARVNGFHDCAAVMMERYMPALAFGEDANLPKK